LITLILNNIRPFTGCLLLFLLTSLAGISPAQIGGDHRQVIVSALRDKRYSEALHLTQAALKQFPNSPQLWTLRSLAFVGQGDIPNASICYQRALKISPDYLPALEGAAQLYYQTRSQQAVPLLEHISHLRPSDLTAHAMLGSLAFSRGDCRSAVEQFERSKDLVETQPAALLQYAGCLAQLKEMQSATAVLQRLVSADSNNLAARRGLAAIQLKAEKPQDALETLSPLLQANGGDVLTLRLAAAAYEANQDTPQAVKILRDAIANDPTDVDLYTDFANIAFRHQSFDAGVEMTNVGIKVQPRSAALYVARGILYVQLARYGEAEADFDKAQELDPTQSFSAAAHGLVAAERLGHPNHGIEDLRERLAKKPDDAFLWSLEASLLSDKDPLPGSADFVEAMRAAKKAVALQPALSSAHDVLAKLFLRAGRNEEATQECKLAIRYNPKDQTALYRLILTLRKNDRKGEIPDLLKRLAQLRQEATQQEAENNRYKLIIQPYSGRQTGEHSSHN
jgi:tetratricopeptide (TPR) repeat protein